MANILLRKVDDLAGGGGLGEPEVVQNNRQFIKDNSKVFAFPYQKPNSAGVQMLRSVYPNMAFKNEPEWSDHPVLNFLTHQMVKNCYRGAKTVQKVLLIGATPKEIVELKTGSYGLNKDFHAIMGKKDSRDWARYEMTASSLKSVSDDLYKEFANFLRNPGIKTTHFSTPDTYKAVDFTAEVAFAFNSLYDIKRRQVLQYLRHFRCTFLQAVMIWSPEMVCTDSNVSFTDDGLGVKFECIGNDVSMTFPNTQAIGYLHTRRQLRKWHSEVHYRSSKFADEMLIIEPKYNWGRLVTLNIVRTPNAGLIAAFTKLRMDPALILCIDFVEYFKYRTVTYRFLRRDKLEIIVKHMMKSTVDSFRADNGMQFFEAITHQVVVANMELVTQYDISIEDFTFGACWVFFMAALARSKVFQANSLAVHYARNLSGLFPMFHWIQTRWEWFKMKLFRLKSRDMMKFLSDTSAASTIVRLRLSPSCKKAFVVLPHSVDDSYLKHLVTKRIEFLDGLTGPEFNVLEGSLPNTLSRGYNKAQWLFDTWDLPFLDDPIFPYRLLDMGSNPAGSLGYFKTKPWNEVVRYDYYTGTQPLASRDPSITYHTRVINAKWGLSLKDTDVTSMLIAERIDFLYADLAEGPFSDESVDSKLSHDVSRAVCFADTIRAGIIKFNKPDQYLIQALILLRDCFYNVELVHCLYSKGTSMELYIRFDTRFAYGVCKDVFTDERIRATTIEVADMINAYGVTAEDFIKAFRSYPPTIFAPVPPPEDDPDDEPPEEPEPPVVDSPPPFVPFKLPDEVLKDPGYKPDEGFYVDEEGFLHKKPDAVVVDVTVDKSKYALPEEDSVDLVSDDDEETEELPQEKLDPVVKVGEETVLTPIVTTHTTVVQQKRKLKVKRSGWKGLKLQVSIEKPEPVVTSEDIVTYESSKKALYKKYSEIIQEKEESRTFDPLKPKVRKLMFEKLKTGVRKIIADLKSSTPEEKVALPEIEKESSERMTELVTKYGKHGKIDSEVKAKAIHVTPTKEYKRDFAADFNKTGPWNVSEQVVKTNIRHLLDSWEAQAGDFMTPVKLANIIDKAREFVEKRFEALDFSAPRKAQLCVADGVAGCGKTIAALLHVLDKQLKHVLFVSSSLALRHETAENAKEMGIPIRDCHFKTIHKVFTDNNYEGYMFNNIETVIIDEYATHHVGYLFLMMALLPNAKFIFIGDMEQSLFHDKTVEDCAQFQVKTYEKQFALVQREYRTKRFGPEIIELLKKFQPHYKCELHPDNVRHTKVTIVPVEKWDDRTSAPITFSSATEAMLMSTKRADFALTVKAAQGVSREKVTLYLGDSDWNAMNSTTIHGLTIVSLTRATKELVIVDATSDRQVERWFNAQKVIDLNDLNNNVKFVETPSVVKEQPIYIPVVPKTTLDGAVFDKNIAALATGLSLGDINQTTESAYTSVTGEHPPGRVKLVPFIDHKKTRVAKSLVGQRKGNDHRSADKLQSHRTAVARTQTPPGKPNDVPRQVQNEVFRAFVKHCIKPEANIPDLIAATQIKVKDILDKYEKLKGKLDGVETFTSLKAVARTFLKQQMKIKADDAIDKGKPGQEIISWDTSLSLAFQGVANEIKVLLKAMLKDEFMITDGLSDAQIAETLEKFAKSAPVGSQFFESDITFYDNNQNQGTLAVEAMVYNFLFGDWMGEFMYYLCRKSMKYFGPTYNRTVTGNRASGEPFTYIGNTILSMIMTVSSVDMNKVHFGMFCGDDVLLIVTNFKIARDYDQRCVMSMLGVQAKIMIGDIGTFCGHICDMNGTYVIAPRVVGLKLLTKDFANKLDVVPAFQIAIKDMTREWKKEPMRVASMQAYLLGDGTTPEAVFAGMQSIVAATTLDPEKLVAALQNYFVLNL